MNFLAHTLVLCLLCLLGKTAAQENEDDGDIVLPLPGDLINGANSLVAMQIMQIIQGTIPGENNTKGPIPTGEQCTADRCCPWYQISDTLTELFVKDGRCNDAARSAIRLGFHDAGTWSSDLAAKGEDYGGADGSIFLFNEFDRAENNGLEAVGSTLGQLAQSSEVSVADMIQFASAHATVSCALGPRMRTFVGRLDATRPAPDGLLPDVHASAESLDMLFQDKGISPHDLAALLGAHSVGKQFHVDTNHASEPLDRTPEVWDVDFYDEILQGPANGSFHLESDIALANYGPVQQEWKLFVGDQHHWNEDYAPAWLRLSLLGVNNINTGMYECTDALPPSNNPEGSEDDDNDDGEEDGEDEEEEDEREGEHEEDVN